MSATEAGTVSRASLEFRCSEEMRSGKKKVVYDCHEFLAA